MSCPRFMSLTVTNFVTLQYVTRTKIGALDAHFVTVWLCCIGTTMELVKNEVNDMFVFLTCSSTISDLEVHGNKV